MSPSTSKKNLRTGSGSPAPSVTSSSDVEFEKSPSADVAFEDNTGTQTGRIPSGDAATSNMPKADEPLLPLPVGQQRDLLLRAVKELIARKNAHTTNQVTFRSDDPAWGDLATAVRVVEAGRVADES